MRTSMIALVAALALALPTAAAAQTASGSNNTTATGGGSVTVDNNGVSVDTNLDANSNTSTSVEAGGVSVDANSNTNANASASGSATGNGGNDGGGNGGGNTGGSTSTDTAAAATGMAAATTDVNGDGVIDDADTQAMVAANGACEDELDGLALGDVTADQLAAVQAGAMVSVQEVCMDSGLSGDDSDGLVASAGNASGLSGAIDANMALMDALKSAGFTSSQVVGVNVGNDSSVMLYVYDAN